MGKLHEHLAVEVNYESAADKLTQEVISTFKNKENLFKGKTRTLTLFGKTEENRVEYEAIEAKDSTNIPISATVPDNLNYLAAIVGDYYDIVLQKELANQEAKADLVINGQTLLAAVPATFLLGMETKLKKFRTVIEEIPTLNPGIEWKGDESTGDYVFKSPDINDVKTAKAIDHKIIFPPTDKQPGQFVPIEINKNIGSYVEVQRCGLISVSDKAKLLERLDSLLKGVKQARQRANCQEVSKANIGDSIFAYLLGPWFDRNKVNPGARI